MPQDCYRALLGESLIKFDIVVDTALGKICLIICFKIYIHVHLTHYLLFVHLITWRREREGEW